MAQFDAAEKEVLSQVPHVLRALKAENVKLASALAGYERRTEAEEIVSMMEARGFSDQSVSFKDKVAKLVVSEKDFGVLREAISMATPDMSFASVTDAPAGAGVSDLEDFILS